MNKLANLSTRQILALLLIVALALSLLSFLENPGGWTPEWRSNWLANLSSEILGAIITFALFDRILARRADKERLIREMGSPDNATALNAVRELSAHGWLDDGSLVGAFLYEANLQSAVLGDANLQEAFLDGANLKGAMLVKANLSGAILEDANLQDAVLAKAYLDDSTIFSDRTDWTPDTDLARFTDPNHPNFWRSDNPKSPAYRAPSN